MKIVLINLNKENKVNKLQYVKGQHYQEKQAYLELQSVFNSVFNCFDELYIHKPIGP